MKFDTSDDNPKFNESVWSGECSDEKGIVVYYSNRCPFAEFYVKESLVETTENRNIPLKVIKLKTMEEAQNAPSPATIFSLFLDRTFMTKDLSVCTDSRFDKVFDYYINILAKSRENLRKLAKGQNIWYMRRNNR